MTKILIDTNIIIDHLRLTGKTELPVDTDFRKLYVRNNVSLYLSAISIQELFEGESTRNKKETNRVRRALQLCLVKELNSEIAEKAGKLMRDKMVKEFADASIAATAILEKVPLLTKNKKGFANIKGLKFYNAHH